MSEFLSVVPSLRVRSIPRALPFYAALGLRLAFAFEGEREADGSGEDTTFARVDGSDAHRVSLFLERERRSTRVSHGCVHLIAPTPEEVDRTARRLEEAGFDLLQPPEDQPHGMRELWVRDPDGNLIAVAAQIASPTA